MADPFAGIGKPKPLKYSLEGYWSRRIDSEHRIIYRISGDTLEIIALRGHYE
jgi:toxin YoeB